MVLIYKAVNLTQEQQFTLILQTLQQLRDVYGESVDKIVQGNTSNIVFLKSTDDAMLDTLQKMSGTTHMSFTDSKTITRDMQKLMMQNEGKASYTMTTREVPVISYNDMAFITKSNSIIFRAGDSPIWNRNETVLPMSWRLFKNTITQPGKNYTLQTIPTLSSALDFDIRQNQPDFIKMLDKRMAQASQSEESMKLYKDAYGYSDADISKLDNDAYSDDIMDLIVSTINNELGKDVSDLDDDLCESDDVFEIDDLDENYSDTIDDEAEFFGMFSTDEIESDEETINETAKRQQAQSILNKKIYAGGFISKADLVKADGSVKSHVFDKDFTEIFANNSGAMLSDSYYFTDINGSLYSATGVPYIIKNNSCESLAEINKMAHDSETKIYSDGDIDESELNSFGTYIVTDDFYRFLANLDSWSFADNRFEDEMARRMLG